MNSTVLMDKASRAVASAKLLLDAGDVDGTCNRAYYAMFDAARAALIGLGVSVEPAVVKTHSGLIAAFSLHLVKTGRFPVELGKALNRVAEIRLVADYSGEEVTIDRAQWVIEQADRFVGAVRQKLEPPKPEPDKDSKPEF